MGEMYQETIGDRIRNLRLKKKMTQQELADINTLRVQRNLINYWENNERDIKSGQIIALADFFNTTCDYILRGVKSENIDINRKTGLLDKPIDMLEQFSAEYIEPPNLKEIIKKCRKADEFRKRWPKGKPEKSKDGTMMIILDQPVPNDEFEIYEEYLKNKEEKEILRCINLLLESDKGINIIKMITRYFNVHPDDIITAYTEQPSVVMNLNSEKLRAMYAQATTSAMQEYQREMQYAPKVKEVMTYEEMLEFYGITEKEMQEIEKNLDLQIEKSLAEGKNGKRNIKNK